MKEFFFDFETRSRVDLRKVGAVKYATDPSTEATLLTWAIDNAPVRYWRYGQVMHPELVEVMKNPQDYKFIAHNAEFDYLVWNVVFTRQFNFLPEIPIDNLMCTMAMSQRYCSGRGLDQAAQVLKLPVKKHPEGRKIMLKQCKPNAKGEFPELTEMEWDIFIRYGVLDTDILRRAYRLMPALNGREQWAFMWTTKRNLKGIKLDMKLLKGMERILKIELPQLSAEFKEITGGLDIGQNAAFLEWVKQWIPRMPNCQAETIRDVIPEARKRGIDAKVIRALEIKSLAGSASIKKVRAALDREYKGRLYQNLVYNGTHTMRWAGSGFQIQNVPRSDDIGDIEEAVKVVSETPELAGCLYDCPISLVKSLLRRIFIPDDGYAFYCGDYSKIEPTVLFWLLGLGPIPKNWYEDMASTIYSLPIDQIGKDSSERQVGKAAALGCAYGLGHKKFRDQVRKQAGLFISEEEAQRAVKAYRRKYHQVTKFWSDIERAFLDAIAGRTTSLCQGRVVVQPMPDRRGVEIVLPSKAKLYYHSASFTEGGLIFAQARQGKVDGKGVYGGLLTEHIVSATARELMCFGMNAAEKAGFEDLNCVHDELWAQGVSGRAKEFEAAMCTKPLWAHDIAMTAEPMESKRYMK